MKLAIVYYSYSGNNESLAKELRLRFGSDLVKIEEQKKRTSFTILLDLAFGRDAKVRKPKVFLRDYETLIFIAPVWDFKIATPMKSFIKMEREHIRNYAFITVCGGREGQKQKITEQLQYMVGKKPIGVTELEIKSILHPDLKDDAKWVASYKIKDHDFSAFKKPIRDFVNTVFSYSKEHTERIPLMKVN
ncbi:MAG: hypothetical protein HYR67_02325 [Bacteroidetes bacterium]|nr:hypothetical protein [Bacteroidota bacterium]